MEAQVQLAMIDSSPPSTPPGFSRVEALFSEHHARVFQAAYRVTGRSADAEDVLQTVFLRLVRRGEEIDLRPSPGSYLYRAAVNAALDVVRSRRAARAVSIEEGPGPVLAASGPSPERAAEDRELSARLRQALAQLTPRAAEIFVLKYFESLSNGEIARMVGASPSAVAVSLFRSRGRLRRDLATEKGAVS